MGCSMLRSKIAFVTACLMALLFLACGTGRASAQQCPRPSAGPATPPAVRPLVGRLIYHDGIRQWFELRLDKLQCGKRSIQLVQFENGPEPLAIFRGCRIRSSGPIDFSPTGYYSLDLYQDARHVA